MRNIKVDAVLLREKIKELRKEKANIDEALGVVYDDSKIIEDIWSGNAGDFLKENLDNFSSSFSFISYQLEKYIYFLEGVANLYEKQDIKLGEIIDSNYNNDFYNQEDL